MKFDLVLMAFLFITSWKTGGPNYLVIYFQAAAAQLVDICLQDDVPGAGGDVLSPHKYARGKA